MTFVIFSFNRAEYLLNSVLSVLRNAHPNRIIVYDDYSDCKRTQDTLEILSMIPLVEIQQPKTHRMAYHGGLYNNMNDVLYNQASERFAVFMQDDMQIVRSMTESENKKHTDLMRETNLQFLYTCFLKGVNRARDEGELTPVGSPVNYYKRTPLDSGSQSVCSDVGLMDLEALRYASWSWGDNRSEHIERAKKKYLSAAVAAYPFMMFLPSPKSYKYRQSGFSHLISERLAHTGYHPYSELLGRKLISFFRRSPDVLPFAEDWLTAETASMKNRCYDFSDPRKCNRFTQVLFYIENRFKPFR